MYKKYESVEVFTDKDGNFVSAIVKDSEGKKNRIEGTEVLSALVEFAKQEEIELDSLLKNKDKISWIDMEKENSHEEIPMEEEHEEVTRHRRSERAKEDKKEKKSSKKRKIIKGLSLAAGGIVLFEGGKYAVNRIQSCAISNNNDDSKVTDENQEEKSDQDYVDETFGNNTVNVEESTYSPVYTTKPGVGNPTNRTFAINLSNDSRFVETNRLVREMMSGQSLDDGEYEYIFNSVAALDQANIAEVENLINGGSMSGDEYELHYENMFDYGTFDYQVVSLFCDMRNNIVHNAYSQNGSSTADEVNHYMDFFINFVYNGLTLEYNGQYFGYYDLSPAARFIVVDMGHKMLTADHNYRAFINGDLYEFNDLVRVVNDFHIYTMNETYERGNKRY